VGEKSKRKKKEKKGRTLVQRFRKKVIGCWQMNKGKKERERSLVDLYRK